MITIPDFKALTEPGFCGVVAEMISEARSASICGKYEPVARRPRKGGTSELVMDLIHHQLHQEGALADNAAQLGGEPISDWAYAQRRALLPVELFGELLEAGLEPMADALLHGDGFHKGRRVVGINGAEVSVTNTASNRILPKACHEPPGRRRLRQTQVGHRDGIGTSQSAGRKGGVSARLRARHGPDAVAPVAQQLPGDRRPHLRSRQASGLNARSFQKARSSVAGQCPRRGIKAESIKALCDGSLLVRASPGRRKAQPAAEPIVVREIRAVLGTPDGRSIKVRLWTSLRKLLLATCLLREAFDMGSDFLTKKQKKQMIARYNQRLLREAILPKRRKRTCQRAVRQPVSS
jgi:hypothetical protein